MQTNSRGVPYGFYLRDNKVREEMMKMYVEEEKTSKEIADHFKVSNKTVLAALRSIGVGIRTTGQARRIFMRKHPKEWAQLLEHQRSKIPIGPNAANWKGGRFKESRYGYIVIWTGPNQRQYEHIVVWEKAHGPVPKGWAVHHLNGIKDDNRIENLVALAPKEHGEKGSPLLKATQARIIELERIYKELIEG